MKYAENADYLIASIIHLGTQAHYWGRTPSGLAAELSLDEATLLAVFEGFPGLFRKTHRKSPNGQYSYSLQARHAQRAGGRVGDPGEDEDIAPLDNGRLNLLLKFISQMIDQ